MLEMFEQQAAAFGAQGALFGLDLGEKTIGVAVCDPARQVATPVETIRRKKFTADAERLASLATRRNVVGLVIGLPLNMDGSEGPRAQAARAFARNLARILPLPTVFWDERLSTAAMERELIALDTSRARRAEKIDEKWRRRLYCRALLIESEGSTHDAAKLALSHHCAVDGHRNFSSPRRHAWRGAGPWLAPGGIRRALYNVELFCPPRHQ